MGNASQRREDGVGRLLMMYSLRLIYTECARGFGGLMQCAVVQVGLVITALKVLCRSGLSRKSAAAKHSGQVTVDSRLKCTGGILGEGHEPRDSCLMKEVTHA